MFLTLRGVLLKSFVCNVASLYQCINFGSTLKSVRHLQRDPMRVLPNVLGIPMSLSPNPQGVTMRTPLYPQEWVPVRVTPNPQGVPGRVTRDLQVFTAPNPQGVPRRVPPDLQVFTMGVPTRVLSAVPMRVPPALLSALKWRYIFLKRTSLK